MPEPSLYERVGGMPFFEALVDRFYDGVAEDDILLPLYPERDDLLDARAVSVHRRLGSDMEAGCFGFADRTGTLAASDRGTDVHPHPYAAAR